jgi:hypothetical protein
MEGGGEKGVTRKITRKGQKKLGRGTMVWGGGWDNMGKGGNAYKA